MARERSEQSTGSVSSTHTESSVVGSHVRASAWVLGRAGSLWGQSCVNHTHLPSAPRVRGGLTPPKTLLWRRTFKVEVLQGWFIRGLPSSDGHPSGVPSGVRSSSSSKDTSQNRLKTALT